MKTHLSKLSLFVVLLGTVLSSCEKVDFQEELTSGDNTSRLKSLTEAVPEICGDLMTYDLILEKSDSDESAGTLTVGNDGTNLYVTISSSIMGYMLLETYMFAGLKEEVPYYDWGVASDQFPYKMGHYGGVSSYMYTIPLSDLPDCFTVIVKIKFRVYDEFGNVLQSDVRAWAGFTDPSFSVEFPGLRYFEYCEQDCDDSCDPDLMTVTQGGWGTRAEGNNPGSYRDANFDAAFPNGLVVGDPNNFYIKLTSSLAVENLLPTGGKASAFTSSIEDPEKIKNVLVGQVVALSLNVGFDDYDPDFGASDMNLGDAQISDGLGFDNYTVRNLLDEANMALGGNQTAHSVKEIVNIVDLINNYQNSLQGDESGPELFVCSE